MDETAFRALQRAQNIESPVMTKTTLQQFIIDLRRRNVKPVSCNTYIKAMNAFCVWLNHEGHYDERLELTAEVATILRSSETTVRSLSR